MASAEWPLPTGLCRLASADWPLPTGLCRLARSAGGFNFFFQSIGKVNLHDRSGRVKKVL